MANSINDDKPQEEFELEVPSSEDAIDRKKEAALVRKLDLFIAPVMMLLMLISYLDRGNVGYLFFSSLKGEEKDQSLFYVFSRASITKPPRFNRSDLLLHKE